MPIPTSHEIELPLREPRRRALGRAEVRKVTERSRFRAARRFDRTLLLLPRIESHCLVDRPSRHADDRARARPRFERCHSRRHLPLEPLERGPGETPVLVAAAVDSGRGRPRSRLLTSSVTPGTVRVRARDSLRLGASLDSDGCPPGRDMREPVAKAASCTDHRDRRPGRLVSRRAPARGGLRGRGKWCGARRPRMRPTSRG